MPPCIDVYVWIDAGDSPTKIGRFIDRYIDTSDPGDSRFDAFVRQFVVGVPWSGDQEALEELRRDPEARNAVSVYVRSTSLYGEIITITEEGDAVLGLSIDDADDEPDALECAGDLMFALMREFAASAGVVGVELPPHQSRAEWREAYVLLRAGQV